jgi:leucyl-tRNA---protein transferase
MESALHYVSSPERCGYLPDRDWRFENIYVLNMTPAEYGSHLENGWRRFGQTLFRPRCEGCTACQSLRIPVAQFRPNRSQKRNAAQNESEIALRVATPRLTRTKLDLFDRYHQFQSSNKGWPGHAQNEQEEYRAHFLDNPIPTEEWRYSRGQQLVGVGYVDVVPHALSGIYFFYEPEARARGLGIWNVLCLIEQARLRNLTYVYLGYFVPGCATMKYKSGFHPHERRQADGIWKPVATKD